MRGATFQRWVLAETQVDLLYPHQGLLHPVEIKAGTTFATDWLRGCELFKRYAGKRSAPGLVVYGGADSFDLPRHHVMSWQGFRAQTG